MFYVVSIIIVKNISFIILLLTKYDISRSTNNNSLYRILFLDLQIPVDI